MFSFDGSLDQNKLISKKITIQFNLNNKKTTTDQATHERYLKWMLTED